MRLYIGAAIVGTALSGVMLSIGWQHDIAWIPQAMLIGAGYTMRSVIQIFKEGGEE